MTISGKFGYFILVLTLLVTLSEALDEDSAKERRCVKMESVNKWYFPLWSKLDLYRTASDILAQPISTIPESALDWSCVIADQNFLVDGFNQTEVPFDTVYAEDGTIGFKPRNSKYAKSAKHTIVHTNNKDFILGVTCWEDDELTYGAWTVEPTISDENRKLIIQHLDKLGFKREYLVETPFDKCKEGERFKNKNKREL